MMFASSEIAGLGRPKNMSCRKSQVRLIRSASSTRPPLCSNHLWRGLLLLLYFIMDAIHFAAALTSYAEALLGDSTSPLTLRAAAAAAITSAETLKAKAAAIDDEHRATAAALEPGNRRSSPFT